MTFVTVLASSSFCFFSTYTFHSAAFFLCHILSSSSSTKYYIDVESFIYKGKIYGQHHDETDLLEAEVKR